jgi:hypothetical protein
MFIFSCLSLSFSGLSSREPDPPAVPCGAGGVPAAADAARARGARAHRGRHTRTGREEGARYYRGCVLRADYTCVQIAVLTHALAELFKF